MAQKPKSRPKADATTPAPTVAQHRALKKRVADLEERAGRIVAALAAEAELVRVLRGTMPSEAADEADGFVRLVEDLL